MEPSWSLHLLSEILSAFSTDAPEDLRNVLNRVAESVDAEVAAVVCGGRLDCCIGLAEQEQELLRQQFAAEPREVRIGAGQLHTYWPPLGENDRLVVGRLGEPFDLEERSLLRAMARSIQLSLRLLQAISAERQARLDASYQASHDPLTHLPNRTLGAADLVERIQPILEASGILRSQVFLEITETSLVDDILSTATTIAGLRQLGVRLAIDDFGTGYSSLLYLKRFPVGLLKIDRSFVANLGSVPEDEAIARAIISLARALGVDVVAEGVETSTQRNWLADLGCAYGQGYLFGRAQPIEVIERELIRPRTTALQP